MGWRRVLCCGLLAGVAFSASAAELPVEQQPKLLLRLLAYDHIFETAIPATATVLLLHNPEKRSGKQQCEQLQRAITDAAGQYSFLGSPIVAKSVPWTDASALQQEIAESKPITLYLCPGFDTQVEAVIGVTREQELLSSTGTEAYLEHGVSVALVRQANRAVPIVQLTNMRAEGRLINASVLRLAETRE